MSPNQKALNLNKDIDELNGEPRGKVQYQRPRLTTHSTGRAISKSFIENLPVSAACARRLIRALDRYRIGIAD
jgi:hypothetical protein